jgi:hypothetical protein
VCIAAEAAEKSKGRSGSSDLWNALTSQPLADAGEFYVDGAAEPCVEEQVPAGVVVVIVDVDIVTIPIPIATVGHVVGGNDPVRAVVEDDVAGANIVTAKNVVLLHVFVAAVWIVAAGPDAIVIVVPVGVVGIVRIVPALVPSVVVALAITVTIIIAAAIVVAVVLLPAAVLAMVIGRRSKRRTTGNEEDQAEKNYTCKKSPTHYLLSPSGGLT